MKDSLGNEFGPGDRVIYNLSGELALGVVKELKESTSRWQPITIYVEHIKGSYRPKTGVSKVKDGHSIVNLDAS